MTDKQPEALRLADQLERMSLSTQWDKKAAAELRRLHEVNAELVEALKVLASHWPHYAANMNMDRIDHDAIAMARAALAKAQGKNND